MGTHRGGVLHADIIRKDIHMICIREKIMKMLEEYSITSDNPTVLRALMRLSAIVEILIEEIENLDPKDWSDEIAALDARVTKLEQDMQKIDPDAVDAKIAVIKATADEALSTAQQAAAAASAAAETANQAKSEASSAESKANMAKLTAEEAKTTADNASSEVAAAQILITELKRSKQDNLTFDESPTENSNNPVTSDGIYRAIQAGGGGVALDDEVTADSQNGVKSSGIYSAIDSAKTFMLTEISNTNETVSAHTDDISALQEFQNTQEVTNETHNTQIALNQKEIHDISGEVSVLQADKQDAMKAGDTPISAEVVSDLSNRPEDGKLATALAVFNALPVKPVRRLKAGSTNETSIELNGSYYEANLTEYTNRSYSIFAKVTGKCGDADAYGIIPVAASGLGDNFFNSVYLFTSFDASDQLTGMYSVKVRAFMGGSNVIRIPNDASFKAVVPSNGSWAQGESGNFLPEKIQIFHIDAIV